MLGCMNTMTDDPTGPPPGDGGFPPADPPPSGGSGAGGLGPGPAVRQLRRSSSDRVVGGVAGGLGRYFDVDPVVFRVLFAVTAFFGGVGLVGYALAWALIPEEGVANPPVDRLIGELRRRKIPFWPAVVIGGLILWGVLQASTPWGIGPVVIAAVIIGLAFRRRQPAPVVGYPADAPRPAGGPTETDPTEVGGAERVWGWSGAGTGTPPPAGDAPSTATAPAGLAWIDSAKAWKAESRHARSLQRRRVAPVRWIAFAVMALTLGIMFLIDLADGIPIAAYAWAVLIISLDALVIGGLLRRTPWSYVSFIPLALVVLIAFGGTKASFTDGTGSRLVAPQTIGALKSDHRMAFGQTTLDLSAIGNRTGDSRTIHVRLAAGRVVLDLPKDMAVTVHTNVRFGDVSVGGHVADSASGIGIARDYVQQGDGGGRLTVDVELAAGELAINHVG